MRLVSQPLDIPNNASSTRNAKSELIRGVCNCLPRMDDKLVEGSWEGTDGVAGPILTLQARKITTKMPLAILKPSSCFLLQIWNLEYEQMIRPIQSAMLNTMKCIEINI